MTSESFHGLHCQIIALKATNATLDKRMADAIRLMEEKDARIALLEAEVRKQPQVVIQETP